MSENSLLTTVLSGVSQQEPGDQSIEDQGPGREVHQTRESRQTEQIFHRQLNVLTHEIIIFSITNPLKNAASKSVVIFSSTINNQIPSHDYLSTFVD